MEFGPPILAELSLGLLNRSVQVEEGTTNRNYRVVARFYMYIEG